MDVEFSAGLKCFTWVVSYGFALSFFFVCFLVVVVCFCLVLALWLFVSLSWWDLIQNKKNERSLILFRVTFLHKVQQACCRQR